MRRRAALTRRPLDARDVAFDRSMRARAVKKKYDARDARVRMDAWMDTHTARARREWRENECMNRIIARRRE